MKNGDLHVEITAISSPNRGFNHRGKRLEERWTLYHMLHFDDCELERVVVIYHEGTDLIDKAGYTVDWLQRKRYDLDKPIPVVVRKTHKGVEMIEVYPAQPKSKKQAVHDWDKDILEEAIYEETILASDE